MPPSRSRWWRLISVAAIALALQVRVVDAIPATYCSSENTSDGPRTNDTLQSEGECRTICSPYGVPAYAFSITQGFGCWCSNIAPGETTSLSDCHFKCPGFPYEFCGAPHAGLFNYLAIGPKPKGTSGGYTPKPSPQPKPESTSSPKPPEKTTIYHTIAKTVYKTKVTSISGTVVTRKPTTKYYTTNTIVTRRPRPSPSPDAPTTVVTMVTTVSGQVTTKHETRLASAPPASGSVPALTETHTGLSSGAIAGIVIGVLAVIAIVAALIYFCCWRPRRNNDNPDEEGERAINRNTSVLSKVGLLRSGSARNFPPSSSGAAGSSAAAATVATASTISNKPPRLQTDIPTVSGGPSSAATVGTMMSRRDSRPIFVDQRLNPNALMTLDNPSRTSITTLQDNQDYSRPLEVRNP